MKCAFPLIFLVLTARAGPALALPGLTGAPVLNTPIGARSSGMGRAFTAVPGDPEALSYNPGALAFARRASVSATYMNGLFDGNYGFLAAPVPLGRFVLTPACLYFNSGVIDLKYSDPAKAPETVTAESDTVIYLSAGWRPAPELGMGVTLKRVSLELAETVSATSLHYDLGILYAVKNGLSFGASYLNSGGNIKFERRGDPPPRTKKLGASYKFKVNPHSLSDWNTDLTDLDMLLSADWTRTDGEKGYCQGGAEANMLLDALGGKIVFTVRLGYMAGRDSAGVAYGLGLAWKNWNFDYALTPSSALEAVSQVTAGYKF